MKKIVLSIIFAVVIFSVNAQKNVQKVVDELTPLPAGDIHLTNFFENDIQNSIAHWNKGVVPYDKFVDFFRNGSPQFALGEMWGKFVRSSSMYYRYTHDEELKSILEKTVSDALSTQQSNGSISCVKADKQPDGPSGDLWERKYVLLGLEQYYERVEADPAVLKSMKSQADCIINQIGDAPKTSITDLGWSSNRIESSTLLEPFMRLYKLTGEQRYLDFARYIVKTGGAKGYNLFQQAYDNVEPYKMGGSYPKAYEMTSLFEGLAEYYRVTGDTYYKKALLNFYNNVSTKEITIIGNGGGDQPYHPAVMGEAWDNTAFEQTNPDISRMMETCVGVTWIKFCSQILRLTGESSAVDDIEKYIYNGLLGAMKPSGDGFSYVNLLNGDKVTNKGWGWNFDGLPVTCCNLNGPMGLAYIPFVAIMNSPKGPVINLYNAATATAQTPSGKNVKLELQTKFPLSDKVKIVVKPDVSEEFSIRLRIPSWSKKTVVKVNGKKIKSVISGKYLDVERSWNQGDNIEITFDMVCRLVKAPHGSNRLGDDFQAVIYGPIVLARDENIDSDYNKPVKIKADKNGIVKIKSVKPTLSSTRMEFVIPTTEGNIRMTDYASVNCWNGKKICTWLPIRK